MTSAITHVSPMAPALLPMSISRIEGSSPSAVPSRITSGVAEETASTPFGTAVAATVFEKAIIINTLAVTAGFAKFCPIPPNMHLTMIIANTAPTATCHNGIVTGRLSARISPDTTALRS